MRDYPDKRPLLKKANPDEHNWLMDDSLGLTKLPTKKMLSEESMFKLIPYFRVSALHPLWQDFLGGAFQQELERFYNDPSYQRSGNSPMNEIVFPTWNDNRRLIEMVQDPVLGEQVWRVCREIWSQAKSKWLSECPGHTLAGDGSWLDIMPPQLAFRMFKTRVLCYRPEGCFPGWLQQLYEYGSILDRLPTPHGRCSLFCQVHFVQIEEQIAQELFAREYNDLNQCQQCQVEQFILLELQIA